MPLDPQKLNDLRQRVLKNEPWTKEELSGAIKEMIHDRLSNLEMPKAKAKSTKKSTVDLNDLLP